jgi:two-component system KDP operon response regulator KdpE
VDVLIIEDELPIRRFLRAGLSVQNFRVIEAETASGGLQLLGRENPELVILDLGLPDMSGFDLIQKIRAACRVPVIVLSSYSDERSKVEALEIGADDYVTKPFGMDELIARMRTAMRHSFYVKGEDPVFHSGDLMVDLVVRKVTVGGREVKLSPTEFGILQLLVTHAGKVLTHQQILREVWGAEQDVQYLRTYVRQLRQKLEADPQIPRHIVTESGVGYRLQLAESISAPDRLRSAYL